MRTLRRILTICTLLLGFAEAPNAAHTESVSVNAELAEPEILQRGTQGWIRRGHAVVW